MSAITLQSLKHLCQLDLAGQAAMIQQIQKQRGPNVAGYIANRLLARTFGDDVMLAQKRIRHRKLHAARRASKARRDAEILLWGTAT